jgi:hypothetical protein
MPTNQPTEASVQVERFDAYQVCPVVETTTPRDESTCEAFSTLAEAINSKDALHGLGRQHILWTLYGTRNGIAEAIADRATEADTFDLLYSITGIQGRSGQTVYPVAYSAP